MIYTRLATARWSFNLIVLMGFLFVGWGVQCHAQSKWQPDKPVEVIVTTAAGGGNDRGARLMQKIWQEAKLLDRVAVVNKVGGGGAVAYAYAAQNPGDAHRVVAARTGLLSNNLLGISPLNYTEMTPLAMIGSETMALVVRADSPIRSLKDLIARWKADPQSVSISLGGSRGSTTHYVIALLAKAGGVDPRRLKLLTFGGASEAMTNLLGGHIDMMSTAMNLAVEQHKAGKVRVIGTATTRRTWALPDVPTLKDQGFDIVVPAWTIVMGAKGLTPAQIAYWEELLERAVNDEAWKKALQEDSVEWVFMKSEPTREFLRKDYENIRGLLREIGMEK